MDMLFSLFAARSTNALAEIDHKGRILYANQPFDDLFRPEDIRGTSSLLAETGMPEPLKSELQKGIALAFSKNQEKKLQIRAKFSGEEKRLDFRIIPFHNNGSSGVLLEIKDLTESPKRTCILNARPFTHQEEEEKLKERRRKLFFGVLDNFPTFIYMQRRDYTVSYANKKVRELYGDTRGRRCYEVFSGRNEPCPVCPTFEVFDTGMPTEWKFTDNDGRTFLIYDYPYEDENGEALVMELGIDVTDLKRAEKELFRTQKLKTIGMLAGGIAHDLNNNLVPIIFNIEYALNKISDRRLVEPLSESLQAAHRAGELVRQVLEYSRQQDVCRTAISLTPLVRETVYEMKASLPESISIDLEQKAYRDSIFANTVQIRQLLQNLLNNAMQSMPEGGVITVTVTEEDITAKTKKKSPELAPGAYVVLTIVDTGIGIRPENMDRIFEPFFTSRKADGGTGMGLTVVHSTVTGSNGHITVDSIPGMGTMFTIFFPKFAGPTPPLQGELCVLQGENINILLIDDDPGALSAMARSLRQAGFHLETARSGEQGLEIFLANPEKYHLILVDQFMSGMTGLQMAQKILAVNREVRIVICTGRIEPGLEEQARKEGICGFARKPMTPNTLIETVKQHFRPA